jgi:DNA-damage-inducible protein J
LCSYTARGHNLRFLTCPFRPRIDSYTKDRAADALEAMGLSLSDAIRLLMLRIADEKRLPFEVRIPNAKTRQAINELESGQGKKFDSIKSLMDALARSQR